MRIHSTSQGSLLGIGMSLLFAVSLSLADGSKIEVVGISECADCEDNSIMASQAFKGLRVTIDCKLEDGKLRTRGEGELDEQGKFKAFLPIEVLKEGKLKEDCFAQLHSVTTAPCPNHNGLEASKIILQSQTDGKHAFVPSQPLKFSTVICTSAFFWPHYNYPTVTFPLFKLPPLKFFDNPFFKKPLPPAMPQNKFPPPAPVEQKPIPPPVPTYVKPLPPPVPVHKHPSPQPSPVHKKPMTPPVPSSKFDKPCSPFPKIPLLPNFPPLPKISPNLFFPPSPPFSNP